MNEWAWLCSNTVLFINSEIWISCNFHIMKYYPSFDFFPNHLEMWKVFWFRGNKTATSTGVMGIRRELRKASTTGLNDWLCFTGLGGVVSRSFSVLHLETLGERWGLWPEDTEGERNLHTGECRGWQVSSLLNDSDLEISRYGILLRKVF